MADVDNFIRPHTLRRLVSLDIGLHTQLTIESIEESFVACSSELTTERVRLPCDAVVLLSDRTPNDGLYQQLIPMRDDGRIASLRLIGDAEAPNIIAQAVFAGHLAAREFGEAAQEGTPFKVERVAPQTGPQR